MRFYTHCHKYYCGIDLHTSMMYVCITDVAGTILVHKNLKTDPDAFVRVIEPYRDDLAVAVECVFVWYWMLRSGMLPQAYAYPEAMRSTRDLLRRRMYLTSPASGTSGAYPEYTAPVQPSSLRKTHRPSREPRRDRRSIRGSDGRCDYPDRLEPSGQPPPADTPVCVKQVVT